MLKGLLAIYLACWGVAAIAPIDRETWLLENGLVFFFVALLVATHRRFTFSNLSYLLIFLFSMLHVVGSHYTYSAVPVGDWVRDALGLSRNHYDRFVHFGFGLLIAYPMREISLRSLHVHRLGSYLVPVLLIVSASASYEIVEWLAARVADPDLGLAYVGAQGDVWDGQKDMGLALIGALLAMLVTALHRRVTGHEPFRTFALRQNRSHDSHEASGVSR